MAEYQNAPKRVMIIPKENLITVLQYQLFYTINLKILNHEIQVLTDPHSLCNAIIIIRMHR